MLATGAGLFQLWEEGGLQMQEVEVPLMDCRPNEQSLGGSGEPGSSQSLQGEMQLSPSTPDSEHLTASPVPFCLQSAFVLEGK